MRLLFAETTNPIPNWHNETRSAWRSSATLVVRKATPEELAMYDTPLARRRLFLDRARSRRETW
jgi:hypothetical protein